MKKYLLINLIILSILFSACSKQEPETPIEEGLTQEEIDAQVLAQKIEERRVLEEQRKLDLGEFYVSLPSLEEPNDLVTAEAKALYVTSNVAGFEFNLDDIEYYKNNE